MSVAKSLPEVDPFFMQICPLCGASHRMMIRGLYVDPKTKEGKLYPDMGYSFCNCRDIFYTKWENIKEEDGGFNSLKDPIGELREMYFNVEKETPIVITMRDPYFVIWLRPHEFTGFNPRKNFILWDMGSFAEECRGLGFNVTDCSRDMDVESKTPECYHITLVRP